MMRKLIALLAFVAAAGCGSERTITPALASIGGTFTLRSVNGSPLPYTFQNGTATITYTNDVITVADGGTWSEAGSYQLTQNGTTSTVNFTDGGPLSRSGSTVSFFSTYLNANAYWGTFTGSGFDLSDPSSTYSFTN
jgi:hypothetical protein